MIVEVHMDINAMYSLSYGLFVLTAREGEKDNGCIVNTVMQVTIEPNRIVAAIDKRNYTHGMVERTGKFNVSVLGVDSKFETYKHWGFRSGANVDKAKGMALKRADKDGIDGRSRNPHSFFSGRRGCEGRFEYRIGNLRLLPQKHQAVGQA